MLNFLVVHQLQIWEHLTFRDGLQKVLSLFPLNIATRKIITEALWKQVSPALAKSMDTGTRMTVTSTFSKN